MRLEESRQNRRMIRRGRIEGRITHPADDPNRRGETFDGMIADVSAMGLGIDTACALPDETQVAVVVILDDGRETERFKLRGEVRWRTPPGTEGLHRVGILLLEKPHRHVHRWQEMVFASLRDRDPAE